MSTIAIGERAPARTMSLPEAIPSPAWTRQDARGIRPSPDFVEAAFVQTIEAPHTSLSIMMSAPLFRGEPMIEHSLVFITDRATGARFTVDIITTGGATLFSDTTAQGNPILRGLDNARAWALRLNGEQPLPSIPSVSVFTEAEAIRALDVNERERFDTQLRANNFGKVLVVRQSVRFGPEDYQVLTPDQFPSPDVIRRGLQDLTRTINSPFTRRQLSSLALPKSQENFHQPFLELPGGYQFFEPRMIQRDEGEMYLYPVMLKRLSATGETITKYFEVLTKRPLQEMRQQANITLGVESFCSCINSGGRGCSCHAQVDPRIAQSDVVIYAVNQTDMGYGELSRVLLDNIRRVRVDTTTGLPLDSTEDARHALFGIPKDEQIADIRDHDDTAMLAAGLFQRAASQHGSITLPTSNTAKGAAFRQRFMNIHFEPSPQTLTEKELAMERARLARRGDGYVRRGLLI